MSSNIVYIVVRPTAAPPKTTLHTLYQLHASRTPITVLTAYDYPTARACSAHPVDITLVGDSLAQVALGLPSTTHLTLDALIHHTAAVARGTTSPFLIADMPFGSYHTDVPSALANAVRIVREGSADAVKLEGSSPLVRSVVRALADAGIPPVAHLGLLPQRVAAMGGYRVQGRTAADARPIIRDARLLQAAGAVALVLEAVPAALAAYITASLRIPTIGIGAGPHTSGQVLVWDDVMATWEGHKAKFVRRFADVGAEVGRGVAGYVDAVRRREFPGEKEGYAMRPGEWEKLMQMEGSEGQSAAYKYLRDRLIQLRNSPGGGSSQITRRHIT
ncbi:ketopantoate hydroxymethyltransferase [Hygrophoropsis aurantiaca]|uniref:Ketopantoate hydroxymethyltransferase n=1 Tax=Hygrophoropsis aurantiaca TaxID=72124 RepID=A0ACB7ZS46_9AGAM|nr:ketopantoate hydroxymethyltransferase [Hygrophoropsis aurantiaca]